MGETKNKDRGPRRVGRIFKNSSPFVVILGALLLLGGAGLTAKNVVDYRDWASVEATYEKANCVMLGMQKPSTGEPAYTPRRKGSRSRLVCDRVARYQFEGEDYETLEKRYFDGWTISGLKPGTRWVNPSNPGQSIVPATEFRNGVIMMCAGAVILWLVI